MELKEKNNNLNWILWFTGFIIGGIFPVLSILTNLYLNATSGIAISIKELHHTPFQYIIDFTPFVFLLLAIKISKRFNKLVNETIHTSSFTQLIANNRFLSRAITLFLTGILPFIIVLVINYQFTILFKEINRNIIIAIPFVLFAYLLISCYIIYIKHRIQLADYNAKSYWQVLNYGIVGGGIGLLITVLFWIIDIHHHNLYFTISGIKQIHQINKIHWLLDIIPFMLFSMALVGGLFLRTYLENLKLTIHNQNDSFDKVRIFAEKIGNGELEYEYQLTDTSDALGSALIKMRENLIKSAQTEEDRNWTIEGIAKLSDILRTYTDVKELGYHIVVFLINKINAIQGALYVIEEDERKKAVIKMTACYAYNRKRYLSKEFKMGEGLVGQAAIERDYIYRTEIPDSYVTISSGLLGDKKPKSLLIVPLISNETLYGVIEIASLNSLKKQEIDFLKEVSGVIAQTIFNLGVNEKTAKLLDEVNMSQQRMQVLLENASEIITIYEKDGTIRYISPSVERILGYTSAEMIGIKDMQYVFGKGRDSFEKMFLDLVQNPLQTVQKEFSYLKKDGKRIWMEATGKNLLADPAIQGLVVNTRDISIRRKAEKEEKQKGQMQALSENSLDLIIRLDKKGTFFYINPVVEKYSSKKVEDYLKKHVSEVELDTNFLELLQRIIQEVPESKQKFFIETDYNTPSGKRIINVNAIPELNGDNNVESVLIVAHDVTEAKLIEQEIQAAHKKITESINYAERIQRAMLPQEKHLSTYFEESFMFYKPRDVVSGDFPWLHEKNDAIYVAVVDCTGHGVPGAFMSLIGNFILDQSVSGNNALAPSEILDYLHEGVKRTLKQEENLESRDGMDVALCKIDKSKNQVEYAGAHRPFYHVRNGELNEIKGDKYPIGGIQYKNRKLFTNTIINIEKGDTIYFFSDGLPDQIGGTEGKKLMPQSIKDMIIEHNDKSMKEIYSELNRAFDEWKNGYKQIDDVLMIGIRF